MCWKNRSKKSHPLFSWFTSTFSRCLSSRIYIPTWSSSTYYTTSWTTRTNTFRFSTSITSSYTFTNKPFSWSCSRSTTTTTAAAATTTSTSRSSSIDDFYTNECSGHGTTTTFVWYGISSTKLWTSTISTVCPISTTI